jgi:fermentation-respiration switch protein FrsA (DUF1100 family)
MIDSKFPVFRYIKFLSKNHWKSIDRVPLITKPVLYISSLKDEIVPAGQMKQLIEATKSSKRVEKFYLQEGTHNVSW